jgi:hypothetical protein
MQAIFAVAATTLVALATPAVAQTSGDRATLGLSMVTRVGDMPSGRFHKRYARHRNYDWSWERQPDYEGYARPPAGGGWNYGYPSGGSDGFIPGYANGS